jgi:outer membrane protein assembly factor BamA
MAYEPNTSFQFGVGTKLLFKFGDSGLDTRTSNLPASITYTLKNQYIVASDYNFFTNHENYLIKGRNHFLKYPIAYYGAGIFLPKHEKIEVELYNVLFEPLVMRRVYKKWFVGAGIRYNVNWGERLAEHETQSDASDAILKSLGTSSTGFEFASTIDSRDNILNALSGHLIEFTHGIYDKSLGGTNNFGISKIDARTYIKLSKTQLNVLAFQVFSRFTWGNTPLTELSALGGRDLLRGFPEGRFSNNHAIFVQPEFRWQMLELLGMVVYAGAGDVFEDAKDLSFNNMKYSVGTGLRLKIVKSENLNIRFDWGLGFGPDTSESNFYFGIAEAF